MDRSPPNYVKLATTNAAAAAAQQRNERVVLTTSGELNYPSQVKWAPRPAAPVQPGGGELKKQPGTTKIITVGIDGNLRTSVMADSKDFVPNVSGASWTGNRPSPPAFKTEPKSPAHQWISPNVPQQSTKPYVKVVSVNPNAGDLRTSTQSASSYSRSYATNPVVPQQFWSPSQMSSQSDTDSIAGDSMAPSPMPGSTPFGYNNIPPMSQGFVRTRKPCNCTKSMCLKLYCDCFANGELCKNCNCQNCHNSLEFEKDRTRAVKACLDRNPLAFHPKIGATENKDDIDRQHKKGCHCKKSGCLKNYCECYEAKITCTWRCKCVCCQNNDMRRHLRRKQPQNALSTLAISEYDRDLRMGRTRSPPMNRAESDEGRTDSPFSSIMDVPKSHRLPVWCLTDDVVEATALCLLAAAENLDTKTPENDAAHMERAILEEFGRCLHQIVESATL